MTKDGQEPILHGPNEHPEKPEQPMVLSKRQLEDLNRRALKVENKHVFGRKPRKTEMPKKWNDQIDALREKLK